MLMRSSLLLLVCALSACSGEQAGVDAASSSPGSEQAAQPPAETPAPTIPLPRACDLVSAEQVQQVLNQTAGLMGDDPEACVWASSESPGTITMLMVLVDEHDDVAMAQEVFNSVTGVQGNLSKLVNEQMDVKTKKSGQELDDLGDEAWLSASNTDLVGSQQLVARKGARVLTLNVTGMGKTDGLAQRLEVLAREAVVRL